MSSEKRKCFKFQVLARPQEVQEYSTFIHAENKEDALKRLSGRFVFHEIEQVILVDEFVTHKNLDKGLCEHQGKIYGFHDISDDDFSKMKEYGGED